MAGWTKDHKTAITVAVVGALGVIIAAVVGLMGGSDRGSVNQKTGGDGTICIESRC